MIGFTFREITFAVISFILLGGAFGIFYKTLLLLFAFTAYIVEMGKSLMLPIKKLLPLIKKEFRHSDAILTGIKRETFDFLFFTFFGLSYITTVYVTQDGCFRLYGIFISAASFVFSCCASRRFEGILSRLLLIAIRIFVLALNLMLSPIRFIKKAMCILFKVTVRKKSDSFNRRNSGKISN